MARFIIVFLLGLACGTGAICASPLVKTAIARVHDPITFKAAVDQIAAACEDSEAERALILLATEDPGFAKGTEHREWLIKMMLRLPLSERKFVSFSPSAERLLLNEIREGSPESQAIILGSLNKFSQGSRPEVRALAWQLLSSPDYAVLTRALGAIFWLGEPDPMARDILRPLIVDPEHSVDPAIVVNREHYPPLDAWQSIRSAAAAVLLRTSIDLSAELNWFTELDGYAALAAREAILGGCAMPEGQFAMADQNVQQQWIDALLTVTRSTLDLRPISQDEFSVIVSIGARFPAFRQDVGDFFEERVAEGGQSRQRDEMRQILKRWATMP